MDKAISQSGLRWWWLALLVLSLDRGTKMLILHYLRLHQSIKITSWYNLTLVYNRGAAFSLLSHAPGWQSWLFSGVAVCVSIFLLFWLRRLSRREWWESIAIALILGGALGNLCDRFSYGHVIDFVQWHYQEYYWPVFNLADSAICMGSTMLVLYSFITKFKQKKLFFQ